MKDGMDVVGAERRALLQRTKDTLPRLVVKMTGVSICSSPRTADILPNTPNRDYKFCIFSSQCDISAQSNCVVSVICLTVKSLIALSCSLIKWHERRKLSFCAIVHRARFSQHALRNLSVLHIFKEIAVIDKSYL